MLVSQATQPGIESEAAVGPACPPQPSRKQTERAFSVSMVVSGLRCVLTYVILPFVTPFLGLAPGVDREDAEKARRDISERLDVFDPETDEKILRDAGLSDVTLFYSAFTWRGWVGRAV